MKSSCHRTPASLTFVLCHVHMHSPFPVHPQPSSTSFILLWPAAGLLVSRCQAAKKVAAANQRNLWQHRTASNHGEHVSSFIAQENQVLNHPHVIKSRRRCWGERGRVEPTRGNLLSGARLCQPRTPPPKLHTPPTSSSSRAGVFL